MFLLAVLPLIRNMHGTSKFNNLFIRVIYSYYCGCIALFELCYHWAYSALDIYCLHGGMVGKTWGITEYSFRKEDPLTLLCIRFPSFRNLARKLDQYF